MTRALMMTILLAGCGAAQHPIQSVQATGVSADGDTAWFTVVDTGADTVRVYKCQAEGCGEVPVTDQAATAVSPTPRRRDQGDVVGGQEGTRDSADPIDDSI